MLVDSSDRGVRRRFHQEALERAERRRSTLAASGVEEIELRLDEDYVAPLLRYFRRRAERR
jgi:hypothetical protein